MGRCFIEVAISDNIASLQVKLVHMPCCLHSSALLMVLVMGCMVL